MSSPESEAERFAAKAISAFNKSGGTPGRTVRIGDFAVDYVPEAGIWVYKVEPDGVELLIFSESYANRHSDFSDDADVAAARDAFLRQLILQELADV